MFLRLAFGVGLLALGYYVGREMGRAEFLRRDLEQHHEAEGRAPEGPSGDSPQRASTRESGGRRE